MLYVNSRKSGRGTFPPIPQGGYCKMKRGKKYIEAAKLIERGNLYEKAEAVA